VKALVAFGTKYGSTVEVAEAISQELANKGYDVELLDLRKNGEKSVKGFDLVVLGSSVFIGKWTKPAQQYIERNAADLAATKVALFVSCSDVLFPEKAEAAKKMYLEDMAASIPGCRPVAMGLFGGVIDFARYSALTRVLLAGVGTKKTLETRGVDTSAPYDYRDWEQIRTWAKAL
jgi:menaquinone-dependent protoporphyrinogen oxidase